MAVDTFNGLMTMVNPQFFVANLCTPVGVVGAVPIQYGAHFLRLQLSGTANNGSLPITAATEVATPNTAGVIPDKSSQVNMFAVKNASGGRKNYLLDMMILVVGATAGSHFIFADLLWYNGGFNGTVITEQTCSPSALTRPDANGVGAQIALICHTALGSTIRDCTVKYTNSDGTTGRTSTVTLPASFGAGKSLMVPLAYPDKGVRAIESVLLSGSTQTAGNFGVCIFRPITQFTGFQGTFSTLRSMGPLSGGMPEIPADACLTMFMANDRETMVFIKTAEG